MKFRSSTTVNDALQQTTTMDAGIKPVFEGIQLIGPAYPVTCHPGGIITCHKALQEVPEGSILVINCFGDAHGAVWGGLMSIEAIEKGVKGVVVDGAVRDVATIKSLDFPVFSRHVTPRVGKVKIMGDMGDSTVCGGVKVCKGDLIIGDDDGVVVIPKHKIEEIFQLADAIDKKEEEIAKKVREGSSIGELLNLF